MELKIESFCDEGINSNTYLIYSDNECIIIDPSNNLKTLKKYIENRKVLGIFITHGHFDHFKKVEELLCEYDTTVYMHKNAYKKMSDINSSCAVMFNHRVPTFIDLSKIVFIDDNKQIVLNDFIIKCLYLPGHSNCSIGYLIDNNLFIGDVLFLSTIGRYDLPTGNFIILRQTLDKIKKLDKNLMIYPGHDFSFKLEYALKFNDYLK